MNLIEAIKSGRPFRPKGRNWAWVFVKDGLLKYQLASGDFVEQPLVVDQIIADDWEIQEPAVTITRTQYWDAVRETATPGGLARKLGLE